MPLLVVHRRAKKNGAFDTYRSPVRLLGARELAKMTFWQLDIVGVVLVIACLALILVPLTIAHGVQSQWKTAKVIAPLVVGVCCVPAWIIWERSCKNPMVPFRVRICALNQKCQWLTLLQLLKDRAVWGALGIAIMLNLAWGLQGSYLYTVLVVSFDESITSATRISSLYR